MKSIVQEPRSAALDRGSIQSRSTSPSTTSDTEASARPAWVYYWFANRAVLLLCLITGLGLLLRLIRLGSPSIWIDEIWSIEIARLPWHDYLWTMRNQDPNTSLYYAMLHFWVKLGTNEFVVRLMSVLISAATLPAIYLAGRKLYGKRAGLLAALLLAINVFHLQWSQETRGYSLVVLLVVLSTVLFIRLVETPSWSNASYYSLVGALSVYAHLFGALVLVAHWGSLIFLPRKRAPWRKLFIGSGVVALLSLPLLYLVHLRAASPFVPLDWLPAPTPHGIYDVFYQLVGNAEYPGSQGGKPILILYFALCAIAVLTWIHDLRKSGHSFENWKMGLLLSWLVLPIAIVCLISLYQPFFMTRYLLICVPAIVLIAARGVSVIPRRGVANALTIITVVLGTLQLPHYYRHRENFQEWRATTSYVLENERAGDGIVFCVAPGRLLFDYYKERSEKRLNHDLDAIYPAFNTEQDNPVALDYLPAVTEQYLDEAAEQHKRLWLIIYHDHFPTTRKASDWMKNIFASQYANISSRKIDGTTIFLYSGAAARR